MDYCLLVFLLGLVVYILQQKTIEGLDVECATNFEDCEDDPETCIYTRVIGCDDEDIIPASAKTGLGIHDILRA